MTRQKRKTGKKFGTKRYSLDSRHKTKSAAIQEAKVQRSKGNLTRVIPGTKSEKQMGLKFRVFTRKKKIKQKPITKKFGTKRYSLDSRHKTERAAIQEAKVQRSKGNLTRVIPGTKSEKQMGLKFRVFTRKKK